MVSNFQDSGHPVLSVGARILEKERRVRLISMVTRRMQDFYFARQFFKSGQYLRSSRELVRRIGSAVSGSVILNQAWRNPLRK